MTAEIAFLLGVLLGQWLLMYASWRAFLKLVKTVRSEWPMPDPPHSQPEVLPYLPSRIEREDEQ